MPVMSVSHPVAVSVPVGPVVNAIAIPVASRPASAPHLPTPVALNPARLLVTISWSISLPMPLDPNMAAPLPIPVSRSPHLARSRMRNTL